MNVNTTQQLIEELRRNKPDLFQSMAMGEINLYTFIEGCKEPRQRYLPRNLYDVLKAMFNQQRNTIEPAPQQTWGQQQLTWSQQQLTWSQQQQPWGQQQQPWSQQQQPWGQQQLWKPVDINIHLYLQNQRYVSSIV